MLKTIKYVESRNIINKIELRKIELKLKITVVT